MTVSQVAAVDSVTTDSLSLQVNNDLKSKVHYTAKDSIRFDIASEKVYLYGNAHVDYEDITMDAAYIEVDWSTKVLYAKAGTDSSGNPTGLPEFKQKDEKFIAQTVTYRWY